MRKPLQPGPVTAALLLAFAALPAGAAPTETMVVTATRAETDALDLAGNIARIGEDELRLTSATHPYESMVRVPGAWISRGSGQEHLTAIRSPVLTGPGSCGAFLTLEDTLPTRPAGFCNVNQMFELLTEFATAVEVVRGPANALYGSNGLHGSINVLLPEPGSESRSWAGLEAGSNDFARLIARTDSNSGPTAWTGGLLFARDGGYQADSGYDQLKGYFKSSHQLDTGSLGLSITGTALDQDTAGFITGFEAYKDPELRFSNPNPEAFRMASSLRAAASWLPDSSGDWSREYRGYARYSDMRFLQHFLPGKPLEENGQVSAGFTALARNSSWNDGVFTAGLEAEFANGYLEEFQEESTVGSPFQVAVRPQGLHYDYRVKAYMAAGFASLSLPLTQKLELQLGARAEWQRYDYDNRMLDGNTRDDGTPCIWQGNEGCLFSRPADRQDSFFNLVPNAGLLYRFNQDTSGFITLTSGFRAPQATELYRLQTPQEVADIDSERLDAVEIGLRHRRANLDIELVGYYMRKENFIFRDAAGFNVSDGKTDHLGAEFSADWQITAEWYAGVAASLSRQEYLFDRAAAGSETIIRGNEIDTAPATLGSARLGYLFTRGVVELEWAHMGSYYLDAANTDRYDGHELLNLRIQYEPAPDWTLSLRITNLADRKYADRADLVLLATPVYRYFPGHAREYFVGVSRYFDVGRRR